MNYYLVEFTIVPTIPGNDILSYELGEIGFESFVEEQDKLKAYVREDLFSAAAISEMLERYKNDFQISYRTELIQQQNWNAQWESNFNPIDVDKKLLIRAPFHAANPSFPLEIIIQPQMSFGTGHHETTFLIASRMLNLPIKNQSVLDMGCGTGVLAILAEKLAAKTVMAIDNDDWAVENAIENCALNNIQNVIVEKGDAGKLPEKAYNVILANINRNILLADMEVYFKALLSDGYLLLSGFFITDVDQLKEHAEQLGLTFVNKLEKNNWAMLEFKKM